MGIFSEAFEVLVKEKTGLIEAGFFYALTLAACDFSLTRSIKSLNTFM